MVCRVGSVFRCQNGEIRQLMLCKGLEDASSKQSVTILLNNYACLSVGKLVQSCRQLMASRLVVGLVDEVVEGCDDLQYVFKDVF